MKKRMFAIIALVFCLCLLSACKAQANVRADFSADGFITFLDNENFVPGVGQGDFIDQLGKYHYEGEPLSELLNGYFYDGVGGGGYKAGYRPTEATTHYGGSHVPYFGMLNDFKVDEGQDTATYTNQFYTSIALEGLQLPYGIDFTDDLDSVLSKVGILKSADELTEDVRLWQDGYQEIKWQKAADEAAYDPLSNELPPCDTLLFIQEYGIARSDGRPCKVVRTVAFSFYPETDQLVKVELSVVESYPYF